MDITKIIGLVYPLNDIKCHCQIGQDIKLVSNIYYIESYCELQLKLIKFHSKGSVSYLYFMTWQMQ